MKAQTTGTLVDGIVQLDEAVKLPNHSRVNVQIMPLDESTVKAEQAWQSLKGRLRARPIHARGQHFTRDELHERP